MRNSTALRTWILVLGFFIFALLPTDASAVTYTEDFTTDLYADTARTTALWDTEAGALGLHPFVPALVGTHDTPHQARSAFLHGTIALVAAATSGLRIIDVSDPAAPYLLGFYDTDGVAQDVAVAGDIAYVADDVAGLLVIDISDRENPTLSGVYDTPGEAWSVTLAGDLALVGDDSAGLQIIDISSPGSPTLRGSLDVSGLTRCVAVHGDLVALAGRAAGLQLVSIADPAAPVQVGSFNTAGSAWSVDVDGDHAFVADGTEGFLVFDITDPAAPAQVGSFATPDDALGVTIDGDRAFVACNDAGLLVLDVSDPGAPSLLTTLDTPGNAWDVDVAGCHAYVSDLTAGLQILHYRQPGIPFLLSTTATSGNALGVKVSGDHAFMAQADGLQIFDVSDPASPALSGSYATTDDANDVAVSGTLAFVAANDLGLLVIDASDPSLPTLLGSYDTPDRAQGVCVAGDDVYVADGFSGLQVVDVSDPAIPTLRGSYDTSDYARDVTVSGDCAFVADDEAGLLGFDIADPSDPTLFFALPFGGPYDHPAAHAVATWGHIVLTATNDGTHRVDFLNGGLDIFEMGTLSSSNDRDVTTSGKVAFMAGSLLKIQELSVGPGPTFSAVFDPPTSARGIDVAGDLAYMAVASTGLQILRVFQDEVLAGDDHVRSLTVDAADDTIFYTRINTVQNDSVLWEISADGGWHWQDILPGDDWSPLEHPGTDLQWRSTLTWLDLGDAPSVSSLQLDWLVPQAEMVSIEDIPDDQGGWVQVRFLRSARDFSDQEALPVAHYGIWRRVTDGDLLASLPKTPTPRPADDHGMGALPVFAHEGGTYLRSGPAAKAGAFPPGTWAWTATVPAVQQDEYLAVVPTEADSSAAHPAATVFLTTTHTTTPSVWYASAPDSAWSLDNLAPDPPEDFLVSYREDGFHLSWSASQDDDFQRFHIYRSDTPDFEPSAETLVHATSANGWTDSGPGGYGIHYKVTALDHVGNESAAASQATSTMVADPETPPSFELGRNTPNPFNPSTTIRYGVPTGGAKVVLRVYDVSGTLVRTLWNGVQTAGNKTAVWNGDDDLGRTVASGMYFYRLETDGFSQTRKMMLMK